MSFRLSRNLFSKLFFILLVAVIGISGFALTIRERIQERRVIIAEMMELARSTQVTGIEFATGRLVNSRKFCFLADETHLQEALVFLQNADADINPFKYRKSIEFSISLNLAQGGHVIYSAVIFRALSDDVFVARESGKSLPGIGSSVDGQYLVRLPDFANWVTSKFVEHDCI